MSPIPRIPCFLALALAFGATSARAQSFNVDIGNQPVASPIPSSAYGAGAGQAGSWNGVLPTIALPVPLNDLAGAATGVTLARGAGGVAFNFDNASTTGDDQNLMDDCQDVGGAGATTTWTFAGLATGDYRVYTYAWAPDNLTFQSTVSGGTISPPQTCGGAWPGVQQLGVTYTIHQFSIPAGSTIAITIATTSGFGTLNGFQLVQGPPPGLYVCFGDGSGTPCPTGNNSPVGQGAGCLNSTGTGGLIEAIGNPSLSADTLLLHGSGMPFGPCIYYQGNGLINGGLGRVFGDGLRCVTGPLVRLAMKINAHGSSNYPDPGDPNISTQGMVSTPGFRYYEVWYRDSAPFSTPATFNLTRTVCIPWVP